MNIFMKYEDLCSFYKTLRLHPQVGFIDVNNIIVGRNIKYTDKVVKGSVNKVRWCEVTLKTNVVPAFKNWTAENKVKYQEV